MNKLKLKSLLTAALLLNIAILDIGKVSAFSQSEADGCEAVNIGTREDIKLHTATGTEVFKGLGMSLGGAEAHAAEFAERPSGLAALNQVALSRVKVDVIGPNKFDIKITKHHDPAVRIYFELMHTLGYCNPTRTWDPRDTLAETPLRHIKPWLPIDTKKNIFDWVLEQTKSLMEILGDPARVIPGVTIRGGVSVRDDAASTASIISKMLTSKESMTSARIDAELRNLFENLLSVKWFARLGPDKEKRATFIAYASIYQWVELH